MTPLRKIGIGLVMTAVAFAITGWLEWRVGHAASGMVASLAAFAPDVVNGDMTLQQAIRALKQAGLTTDELQAQLTGMPSIGWQFLAYAILTAAEVMVSITSLEFAYTQAPRKMKSFIMGIYFLGVSLGNLFTSLVNKVIQNADGTTKLDGDEYYWFFTGLMLATSVVYVFFAKLYRGRTFIQGATDERNLEAEAEAEGTGNV